MSCGGCGPGFPTPKDAMNGPKEKVLYTTVTHHADAKQADYLATVDVEEESPTFSQVWFSSSEQFDRINVSRLLFLGGLMT